MLALERAYGITKCMMYCFEKKVKVFGVIHKENFDLGFGGRTMKVLFATLTQEPSFVLCIADERVFLSLFKLGN